MNDAQGVAWHLVAIARNISTEPVTPDSWLLIIRRVGAPLLDIELGELFLPYPCAKDPIAEIAESQHLPHQLYFEVEAVRTELLTMAKRTLKNLYHRQLRRQTLFAQ